MSSFSVFTATCPKCQYLGAQLIRRHFPTIWMPSTEQRDLRTLLRDRHPWVKMRTRVQNTLQAIALNHALRQGRTPWSPAGQKALQALARKPLAFAADAVSYGI